MRKTIAELIDSLSVINIKIFFLIEKMENETGTVEDARKIQKLNKQRSDIMNALSKEFKEREIIKV